MDYEGIWNKIENDRGFQEFYFFAIALILAFGTLETTGTVLDTEKPVVTVVSCSMYPELDVGDILVVRGTDFEDVEEGDIIVFDVDDQYSDIPIIHRVIETGDGYVGAKGDNTEAQQEFEERIEPDQVHGKTVLRVPRVGLLKILAIDFTGYGDPGNQPFTFDTTQRCTMQV